VYRRRLWRHLILVAEQLPTLDFTLHFLLGDELTRLEELLQRGVSLVFFETATNPTSTVFDTSAIAPTVATPVISSRWPSRAWSCTALRSS
jgi:O-acetylhomoserine/O-acetylserine sulfhydrylase-like pyridoxal-dependent enzyme